MYRKILEKYIEEKDLIDELDNLDYELSELNLDIDTIDLVYQLTAYEGSLKMGLLSLTIKEWFDNLDDYEKVDMINDFNLSQHYSEYYYNFDDENILNEILQGYEPAEIVRMTNNGNFNYNDSFIYINVYNNIVTCNINDIVDSVDTYFYEVLYEDFEIKEYENFIYELTNELIRQGF